VADSRRIESSAQDTNLPRGKVTGKGEKIGTFSFGCAFLGFDKFD